MNIIGIIGKILLILLIGPVYFIREIYSEPIYLVGIGIMAAIIAGIVLIYSKLKNNRKRIESDPMLTARFVAENTKIKNQIGAGLILVPASCLIIFILLYLGSEKCYGFSCLKWGLIIIFVLPAVAVVLFTFITVVGLMKVLKLEKKILEAEKNMQQAVGFEKLVQENAENTWQIDTERQNAHEDSAQKNAENP